jgi:hypothetical protein
MAWQEQMSTIVRYVINDVDSSNYTFSNKRIETSILVAAQLVDNEVVFSNTYSIDIDGCVLSPDPTASTTKDNSFINIVSLRAGCLILGSELKTQGLSAVRVSDGPSSIDMSKTIDGIKMLYEDVCSKYEEAKMQHKLDGAVGEAILSPYSPGANVVNGNYGHGGRYQ